MFYKIFENCASLGARASRMHAPPGTLVLPIILFVFIFTEMKVRIEVAKTAVLVGDMSRKLQFL